jgi:hypothetical protein
MKNPKNLTGDEPAKLEELFKPESVKEFPDSFFC